MLEIKVIKDKPYDYEVRCPKKDCGSVYTSAGSIATCPDCFHVIPAPATICWLAQNRVYYFRGESAYEY